jgi:hypothetical protein
VNGQFCLGEMERLLKRISKFKGMVSPAWQWASSHRRCCCAFSRKKTSNSASPSLLLARFGSSRLLFPKLKSQFKGKRFQDISTIQANVTEQIRSILKDSFKKSFQSLYDHCKSCIDRQRDYVEHWDNTFFLTWIFYFYWHSPGTF